MALCWLTLIVLLGPVAISLPRELSTQNPDASVLSVPTAWTAAFLYPPTIPGSLASPRHFWELRAEAVAGPGVVPGQCFVVPNSVNLA